MAPIVVWIRRDLRLEDNPALFFAREETESVLPVVILDEDNRKASSKWFHLSVQSFQKDLANLGYNLILRRGDPSQVLKEVIRESNASAVFWNRAIDPVELLEDKNINKSLGSIPSKQFSGNLLFDFDSLRTKEGRPFQVFTPFWKLASTLSLKDPLPLPKRGNGFALKGIPQETLSPSYSIDPIWEPGEKGAEKKIRSFNEPLYSSQRDFPAESGTSFLAPHLHFGELSIRKLAKKASPPFLRQLIWREFAHHLLWHFPKTMVDPLRESFKSFPWLNDPEGLDAWKNGLTGYPIVDAGMRQLKEKGWMHNRVRMIVGSFLVKDLLISWEEGMEWFWNTLFDADLANNTFNWQWIGGCGADAAPYFRIFNPVLQAEKFDPLGKYVKTYCPELKDVHHDFIHTPWKIEVKGYPKPIIDHALAKERALKAFHSISA